MAGFPASQETWLKRTIWREIMLVIKVWCLPQMSEKRLRMLHRNIVAAVVSVKELGMKDETQMVCLFPPDMMSYGLGEEIIIEVTGGPKLSQDHEKVRQKLSHALGLAIRALGATIPDPRSVECFFDPSVGYRCGLE